MNSLISNDGEYIGQYLHIKDTEFSIRMFTKFYNLSIQNNNFYIDIDMTRDLIHMDKYNMYNKIYVNDPYDDNNNILKPLTIGSYMVFIQKTKKLYLFTKPEFKKFIKENKYKKSESTNFVIGIDNGIRFENVRIISANSLNIALEIYKQMYNNIDNPICIGTAKDNVLNLFINNDLISSTFDYNTFTPNV